MSDSGQTPSKELPPLRVKLFGEDSSFNKMVNNFHNSVDGMAKAVKSQAASLSASMVNYGRQVAITSALISASIVATTAYPIKLAGEYEQANVAFEVMLGSASKAQSLLKDIETMAAKTPLETSDLVKNSQLLSAYNVQVKDLLPTLSMIGDVALGNRDKFNHLSLAYGQVMAKGRLMGQEVLQMTESGFNPLRVISDMTGRSMADLAKAMENGEISAQMLTDAFKFATSEGGKYNGMMEKQSQTLLGLYSTFRDYVAITLRTIVYDSSALEILKKKVQVGIEYLSLIRAWVVDNKELAGTLFITLTYVGALATVVGTLGTGVMIAGYSIQGFVSILTVATSTVRILSNGLTALQLAFTALRNSAIFSMIAPFLPVIAIVSGIAAAIVGVTYLLVGPEGFSYAWETVKSYAKSFYDTVTGFLANFSYNMGEVRRFVIDVWNNIWENAGQVFTTFIKAVINNIFVVHETMFRLGTAFAGWLSVAIPEVFRRVFTVDNLLWVIQGLSKMLSYAKTWSKEVFDLFQSFAVSVATMLVAIPEKFMNVMLKTAPILMEILDDIVNFRIPDPTTYLVKFAATAAEELGALGKIAATKFKEGLDKIGVSVEALAEQAKADFVKGATNLNFLDTAGDILSEQAAKLKNPLEGFTMGVEGPKFKFDKNTGLPIPTSEDNTAIAPEVDTTEFTKAFDDLEEQKKEAEKKKVKISAKLDFEASAKDSSEAFDKLQKYAQQAGQAYIASANVRVTAKNTDMAQAKAKEEAELAKTNKLIEQHLRAKRKQVEIINVDVNDLSSIGATA